ncbi:hydroxymethylglutaryl-CoA lyase [Paraburkholderia sp. BCC1884]|uniref:hydroxymethylglutaryl-CoA lyase n=1 Tax=Paraburkholderia sp. BCC1884 TaxID=2562668 RepID=UPI001182159F|nr:hydroxymethylglutaryl-CoA lyase [Paraburkholderia sp. BCC1884]
MLPTHVKVVEVGPRDGLQNEAALVPAHIKIDLVNRLSAAGFANIEVTSFVSPKWVPQMADNAAVLAGIDRRPGTSFSALTPNVKGLENALKCSVDEVVIFGSASETFSQRNIACSIAESIERFRPLVQCAKEANLRVRGGISMVFGCPFEGDVPLRAVIDVVERMAALGCDEIDLADTIGVATAGHVEETIHAVSEVFPKERLAGHFHDTYGQALANVLASLQAGISIFHSAVAGLGGCPYAKGATGNVATEDLLYLLHGLGIRTGVDLEQVVEAGEFISAHLGRRPVSRVNNALTAKRLASAERATC